MKKVIILVGLFFVSCTSNLSNQPQVYTQEALGTYLSMTYFADERKDFSQAVDSTINAINQSMSTYIDTSDISQINQGKQLSVDDMFKDNFLKAKEIHQLTKGYFDPTVGLLVNYYGFGPQKLSLEVNDHNTDSLMQYVGFDQVELNAQQQIIKKHPSIYIDFNAIAKGYTVDRIGVLLEQNGISNYIIDIGGEILAKGNNVERDNSWRVGIDRPAEGNNERAYDYIVALNNQAIATSGNYRKYNEGADGEKYVHTIDPLSGKSVKSDVLSASVITSDCMTADAYATAFMSMGYQKSVEIIESLDEIEALFIFIDDANQIQTYVSKGLEDFIEKI
ncbi:MAG: FAD:protein FMN transferase [Flavobacteriaceae bacterium]|nr:FAD:protein FMN transferase [Flavobacteriaceae bacterium]